jgi:hypothetical protein
MRIYLQLISYRNADFLSHHRLRLLSVFWSATQNSSSRDWEHGSSTVLSLIKPVFSGQQVTLSTSLNHRLHSSVRDIMYASSILSVCVVALTSFLATTLAHNIQLGAHSRECFHEELHKDDKMTVTFQVGDREFGGAGNLEIDFWVCSCGSLNWDLRSHRNLG